MQSKPGVQELVWLNALIVFRRHDAQSKRRKAKGRVGIGKGLRYSCSWSSPADEMINLARLRGDETALTTEPSQRRCRERHESQARYVYHIAGICARTWIARYGK